ncbi:hypothetical protein LEMLEM_LOCUS6471 [Lemmus lemmus]
MLHRYTGTDRFGLVQPTVALNLGIKGVYHHSPSPSGLALHPALQVSFMY